MTVTEKRLRDALSAAAATAADVRPLTAPSRRRSRFPMALAVATAAVVGTGLLWVRQAAPQGTAAEVVLTLGSEQKIAVFLCEPVDPFPACRLRPREKAVIAEALRSLPGVESVTFEDKREAYLNFRRQLKDDTELLKAVTEKDLPESFRVLPLPDADRKEIVEAAEKLPGVSNVVDPRCVPPITKVFRSGC